MAPPQPPATGPSRSAGDPPKVAPPDASLSEHARRNRAAWNADADDYQQRRGQQLLRPSGLFSPRPAPDAVSCYRDDEDRVWARRWPAECIWRLGRVHT